MQRSAIALVALLCAIAPAAARAAICTVATATITFGTYDVFNASATTANGTLNVTCNKNNTPIAISLSVGANASNYAPRYLSDGTDLLGYNIFTDATYATVFGDGTGTTQTISTTAPTKNVAFPVTLYGSITANQDVGVGSYSDTVVATVNF